MNDLSLENISSELARATSYPLSLVRLNRFPGLVELVAGETPAKAKRDVTLRAVRDLLFQATGRIDQDDLKFPDLSRDTEAWGQAYRLLLDLERIPEIDNPTAVQRRVAALEPLRGHGGGSPTAVDRWVRDHEHELFAPLALVLLDGHKETVSWIVLEGACRYTIDENGFLGRAVYEYTLECLSDADVFELTHRSEESRGWLRLAQASEGTRADGTVTERELPAFNTDVFVTGLNAKRGDVRHVAYALKPDYETISDGVFAFTGYRKVLSMQMTVETARRPEKVWYFTNVLPHVDSAPEVIRDPEPRYVLSGSNGIYEKTFRLPEVGRYQGLKVQWTNQQ